MACAFKIDPFGGDTLLLLLLLQLLLPLLLPLLPLLLLLSTLCFILGTMSFGDTSLRFIVNWFNNAKTQ